MITLISDELSKQMIEAARRTAPHEVGGLLVILPNGESIKEFANHDPDPYNHFLIPVASVNEAIHAHGREQLVIWHSHPHSRAAPSRSDVKIMSILRIPMAIVSLKAPRAMVRLFGQEKSGRLISLHSWQEPE
jgi:proteasome lid subunit RPN8/RPN11